MGGRVGWDRCGWLLVEGRSEPALRRSRRRRGAGRWSGPAWPARLAVLAETVTVNDVLPAAMWAWMWARSPADSAHTRSDKSDPCTRGGRQFKTKIVTYGTEVNVNAFYRHSRIKQYLKDGRALRIETVINDPGDLGCLRRLIHLDELQARARAVNTTLLDTERVGQGCVLASPAFERIARPTLTEEGRRAPALRFGDPRVQALAGALCTSVLAVTGITNKSLRALMLGLLGGTDYP